MVKGKVLRFAVSNAATPTCACLNGTKLSSGNTGLCIFDITPIVPWYKQLFTDAPSKKYTVTASNNAICEKDVKEIKGRITSFGCYDTPGVPSKEQCGSGDWLFHCNEIPGKFEVVE